MKLIMPHFTYEKPLATELWYSILDFAECNEACGGEGNSGEFHDRKEELRLVRKLKKSEEKLIEDFSKLTGFKPLKTLERDGTETWDFEILFDIRIN